MACTKNPILEYINQVITQHTANPGQTFEEVIRSIGFRNMGTQDDYCCSDCGNLSYIGFMFDKANNPILYDIYKFMQSNFPANCCENYDVNSLKNITKDSILSQSNDAFFPSVCCNSFNDCAPVFNDLIQKYLFSNPAGIFDIYRNGIHEYGTFNGDSILCAINAKIQLLSDADKTGFFQAMYNTGGGFVSFCVEGQVFAGTVEAFAIWY